MPHEREDIEGALRRKGFRVKDDKDHRKFHFWTSDAKKTAIWTKTSRGTKHKVLSDELIAHMARQVKLTKQEFMRFVDCEMEQADYERVLVQKELL